jgi:hypothetical protein
LHLRKRFAFGFKKSKKKVIFFKTPYFTKATAGKKNIFLIKKINYLYLGVMKYVFKNFMFKLKKINL